MKKIGTIILILIAVGGAFFYGKFDEKQSLTERIKARVRGWYAQACDAVNGFLHMQDDPPAPEARA